MMMMMMTARSLFVFMQVVFFMLQFVLTRIFPNPAAVTASKRAETRRERHHMCLKNNTGFFEQQRPAHTERE